MDIQPTGLANEIKIANIDPSHPSSQFDSVLSEKIEKVETFAPKTEDLPQLLQNDVKSVLSHSVMKTDKIMKIYEKLMEAFETFSENIEKETGNNEQNISRLTTVSITMFHLVFSYGHGASLDAMCKHLDDIKRKPKLSPVFELIKYQLKSIFSTETLPLTAHQKSVPHYVSYKEKREYIIQCQFIVWSFMKSTENREMIAEIAEDMKIENPKIEDEIAKSNPLNTFAPTTDLNLNS